MTHILINPGSGPVANAAREIAVANMQTFISELGVSDVQIRPLVYLHGQHHPSYDPTVTGRWRYELAANGRVVEVEMPGRPRDELNFTRLYIDGSSWMWKYAVEMTREILTGQDEE